MGAAIPIRAVDPVELERPDKRLANARARAALLGATLYRGEDDRGDTVFIVSKYNLCRELRDIEAVDAWLDKLAGRAL